MGVKLPKNRFYFNEVQTLSISNLAASLSGLFRVAATCFKHCGYFYLLIYTVEKLYSLNINSNIFSFITDLVKV